MYQRISTGRIAVKFDLVDFYATPSTKYNFGYNQTNILNILHEDLSFIFARDIKTL